MESLGEMEMRLAETSETREFVAPKGAVRQVAEGETIPIGAPPSPKARAASEAVLRLLAGAQDGPTSSDAFFNKVFDSLGELDEQFFTDATDRLSGKAPCPAAAVSGSMLEGMDSEDSSEEEGDEVTGEGESPEAGEAEAMEEWRALEAEWAAEAAAVQSTWQPPPAEDDEFDSAYDAPAQTPARAAPPGAEVLAALRQRLAHPLPEEEEPEEEDSMLVGGLRFALAGPPRRAPLTGERGAAMQQELSALREYLK
eukprot:Hpha_TRINITY_DN8808_c0_g1::TRINITY_DN8808_c0_g1_i1::g.141592::m.141592